jgi:hypothetical protein
MSQQVESRTRTFAAGAALAQYRFVHLSAGVLAYGAADSTDVVGSLARPSLAANDLVPVDLIGCQGTRKVVALTLINLGAACYAAANGKVAATGTVLRGIALEAAAADGDVIEILDSPAAILGAVARASLTQDDLAPYALPITEARRWDVPTAVLPAGATSDDLGMVDNTFLTAAPTIESGSCKNTTLTQYCRFMFAVPPEYVSGETIKVRINAGMKTTVANTSSTIDVECVRQAAPSVDVCATAAQSINSLVAANKDFTITPTDVVPGDILDIRLTSLAVDGQNSVESYSQINKVTLLLDVKG